MRDIIAQETKTAMKSGQKQKLATLRLISAAIKDRDINARTDGKERVSDEEIIQILAKMIKQREEAAKIYKEQKRDDLYEQEKGEIEIISAFMPEQMSHDEIKKACEEAIKITGAESLRDMGKCMNEIKNKYAGKMDFGKASAIIKETLQ